MSKHHRPVEDAHRIVWRDTSRAWYEVRLLCACGTRFRDGIRLTAQQCWQQHHDTLEDDRG